MEKSIPMAIVAIVLSVVAVVSGIAGVFISPATAIGTGEVGTNQIADNSVTGEKISDGTITDSDISTAGVSRIADDAVGSGQIADNSVTLSDLGSDVVDTITGLENIADNSITSEKIQDGTITSDDILDGTITSDDISNNSITSSDVADGTITSADLSTSVSNRLGKAATFIVAADGSGDYTNIQSAIDALPSSGGSVYIREGTYTITSGISVNKSNVSITGAGAATKITLASGANADVITVTGANNVIISSLCIDGNRANQTASGYGVRLKADTENSKVSDCWVWDCYSAGIFVEQTPNNNIVNNNVRSNRGGGIHLAYVSATNNIVSGNVVELNDSFGICVNHCGHNVVVGNTVKSNRGDGVDLIWALCEYTTVTGNTVESNENHGIKLDTCSSNVVTGNTVVSNSTASAGSYDGIYLSNADYNVITSNLCTDPQFPKTQRYGVNVSAGSCDKNLVATNILLGNLTGSLNDAGAGTVKEHNITA